jgi:hypothetical protein
VLEGLNLPSRGLAGFAGLAAAEGLLGLGVQKVQDHGVIIRHTGYNYGPSVLFDGHKYQMWWTGQGGSFGGDHILYAEASRLGGPWSTPRVVFGPGESFALVHTADPCVIRVGGLYYLYYSGSSSSALVPTSPTMIGAAVSADGIHWTPLNGGQPIILPHRSMDGELVKYGAGQPSVLVGPDGRFYMLYWDTTGADSNPVTGGGEYVLRSFDPTFQTGVEEWSVSAPGAPPQFIPRDNSREQLGNLATNHRLLDAGSVDWLYVPTLNAFVIAQFRDLDGAAGAFGPALTLYVFDGALQILRQTLILPGVTFTEAPGFVRGPLGEDPARFGSVAVPLDLVRSVGQPISADPLDPFRAVQVSTWKLAWEEIRLQIV